jgi:outer membrane protein assembly factor BamB
MSTRCLALVVATSGLVCLTAFATDWPQWRGPHRDGISDETGLLKEWPKGGPKLLWQLKDVGSGYGTPAVAGDWVYLLGNTGMDDEYVEARAVADGKKGWTTRLGKVGPNSGQNYPGARSTPTVDGTLLYALGSNGDLACLEAASGKVVWKKNLRTDFGGKPGMWAYAESPLIDGDVLVCTPGGAKATIVALNKKTGDVIWESASEKEDNAAYASPIVMDFGGVKQYVLFLAKGLVGVDAKTGKYLWRYEKTARGSLANIPTPVTHGGYVFSSTGQGGAGLVRLLSKGGEFDTEPVYFTKNLPTSIGGSLLIGDYLYGTNAKGLMCADFASGNVKWQQQAVGPASVCYADGRLYVHGESGEVALAEAIPDAYREKGRFTPPDQPTHTKGQKAWAYPVVANGRLYLRDLDRLWCYDVKADGAAR